MDVLYLIFNLSADAMQRMKSSIDSMRQKNKECTICISDTSVKSLKKTLQQKKIHFDKYAHNPTIGLFNRSKTINLGFKDLVTSDYFLTSDIDLIYGDNFLEKIQSFCQQNNKIYAYGNLIYLPESYNRKSNFKELLVKHEHLRKWPGCGFFLVDSEKFKDVNGFDEDYRGWGAEDEDFNFRMINHFTLDPKKVNSNIIGLHQHHPPVTKISKEQQKCKNENKQRWLSKKKKCLLEKSFLCRNGIKK